MDIIEEFPDIDDANGEAKPDADALANEALLELFGDDDARVGYEGHWPYEEYGHKFSTTQINLPAELQTELSRWVRANIKPNEHAPNESVDEFHVTVKYGLHTDAPGPVRLACQDKLPVPITLGRISAFTDSDDYDVLIIKVNSPEIVNLNKAISDNVEHTDTQAGYIPHVTLAYLKKGFAAPFVERADFNGRVFIGDAVIFCPSSDDAEKVSIPLSRKFHRQLSRYETRVDYNKVEGQFRDLQMRVEPKFRAILKEIQRNVIKNTTEMLGSTVSPRMIGAYRIDVGQTFANAMREFLVNVWREGKNRGYSELPESIQRKIELVKQFHADHDQEDHGNWADDDSAESETEFWHGSPSGDFGPGAIHIGTKLAATQALEARIGVPAVGEWDGNRAYGETKLAGRKTLLRKDPRGYLLTGANMDPPDEDYYPKGDAVYSDGSKVPMDSKPSIFRVSIVGQMTNNPYTPHSDTRANALIKGLIKRGNARRGFFYKNDGEDEGSISAVVPSSKHLKRFVKQFHLDGEHDQSTHGSWASGGDPTQSDAFKAWFGNSKAVDNNGKPKIFYHGTDQRREVFDGSFFTDSPRVASAYAEMKALQSAVDNNDDLNEIVNDILTEEGGESITDLGPKQIREIAEANGIDIGDVAPGHVEAAYLKVENPLDLREFGSDVGDVETLWNKMHDAGLLDEAWSDIDEEFHFEITEKYERQALYRFLEEEGVQAKAFDKGFDAVVFTDMAPDGGATHTSWLVKDGSQIKAKSNRGTFDPMDKRIDYHYPGGEDHDQSSHGNREGGDSERSSFYSPLSRSIESAKQKSAPAKDWISILSKAQGVTKAELEATGIIDYLNGKGGAQVTKDELTAFAKENAVEIARVTLGVSDDPANAALLKESADVVAEHGRLGRLIDDNRDKMSQDEYYEIIGRMAALEKRRDEIAQTLTSSQAPKFGQYTLPGGDNYRELLLTLPSKDIAPATISELPEGYDVIQDKSQPERFQWGITEPGQIHARPFAGRWESPEEAKRAALEAINADAAFKASAERSGDEFHSAHFDQPNVVAHLRMNDRVDADGNKVLFLEEIQSDWAQKGRSEGFGSTGREKFTVVDQDGHLRGDFNTKEEAEAYLANPPNFIDADKSRIESFREGGPGIPSAPFVTDTNAWVGLAMKHAMSQAVDGGYDAIAWTTGEQQAERYDLSKQVDEIRAGFSHGSYFLEADKGDRANIIVKTGLSEKELADNVGKELAARIVADSKKVSMPGMASIYRDVDLKIGGEGMKSFYDNIVPNVAGKLIKKNDPAAKIEKLKMVFQELRGAFRTKDSFLSEKEQQGFYITPKMRENIRKGIALFELNDDARARYIENDPEVLRQAVSGELDFLLSDKDYSRAIPYIKQRHATKKFAGFEPRQAIDYLTTKALVIKGLLDNELTEDARQLLLEHLKGGRTLTETISDLRRLFEPWIGDPQKIGPSGQTGIGFPPGEMAPENILMAYRLENMIRTPMIEAYNQGRLAIGDATDEYVIGYQYSAILDQRTCLHANSLIKLANGKYREIAQVRPGDRIISGTGAEQIIAACWRYPATRWIRLTLEDGREVVCTTTHRWWTTDGWTEALDIEASKTRIGTESWNRIERDAVPSMWPRCDALQQQSAQVLLKHMPRRMGEDQSSQDTNLFGVQEGILESKKRNAEKEILLKSVRVSKSSHDDAMSNLRDRVYRRQVQPETRREKVLQSRMLFSNEAQSNDESLSTVRKRILDSNEQCESLQNMLSEVRADISPTRSSDQDSQTEVHSLQEVVSVKTQAESSGTQGEALLASLSTGRSSRCEGDKTVSVLQEADDDHESVVSNILLAEMLSQLIGTNANRKDGRDSSVGPECSVRETVSSRSLLRRLLSFATQNCARDGRCILAFAPSGHGRKEGHFSKSERHRAGQVSLQKVSTTDRRFTASHANHTAKPSAAGFVRVLKVETFDELAWAYDLEVENDHSYIANGLISHNTEICRENDGLVIRADDPRLRKLTPPVHYQALPAGTPIRARRWHQRGRSIPIEELRVGDFVYTHMQRWRRVTETMRHETWPEEIVLHLSGDKTLTLTDDHPVLTQRGWVCAGDLTIDDNVIASGGPCARCEKWCAGRYCSRRCKHESAKTLKFCQRCKIEIKTVGKKKNSKYCSRACSAEALRKHTDRVCLKCHKKLIGKWRKPLSATRRFCSFHCYHTYKGETSIEKTVREWLESCNLLFIPQYQIGRYTVDYYLPEYHLAIEVDGWYWHVKKPKSAVVQERRERTLFKHGLVIVRIPESAIKSGRFAKFIMEGIKTHEYVASRFASGQDSEDRTTALQ